MENNPNVDWRERFDKEFEGDIHLVIPDPPHLPFSGSATSDPIKPQILAFIAQIEAEALERGRQEVVKFYNDKEKDIEQSIRREVIKAAVEAGEKKLMLKPANQSTEALLYLGAYNCAISDYQDIIKSLEK